MPFQPACHVIGRMSYKHTDIAFSASLGVDMRHQSVKNSLPQCTEVQDFSGLQKKQPLAGCYFKALSCFISSALFEALFSDAIASRSFSFCSSAVMCLRTSAGSSDSSIIRSAVCPAPLFDSCSTHLCISAETASGWRLKLSRTSDISLLSSSRLV